MICEADFEELFPDLFQPAAALNTHQVAVAESAACIARWEDDGGRILPGIRHDLVASARRSQHDSEMHELARVSAMFLTLPATAAVAVAWTVLSAYGQISKARQGH